MTSAATDISVTLQMPSEAARTRAERMTAEFAEALKCVPKEEIYACFKKTPGFAIASAKRKAQSTANLLKKAGPLLGRVASSAADTVSKGFEARKNGELKSFASDTGTRAATAGREALSFGRKAVAVSWSELSVRAPEWYRTLRSNPGEIVPEMVGATLGFMIGSGGFDGDGGLPDTDLLLGIGHHRSFITHSIVIGIATEATMLSFNELLALTYKHLPDNHDPLWDAWHDYVTRTVLAAVTGTGVGLAYHFLADGLVQVASYKDLPISLPIEAHQTLFVANAGIEATDAATKRRTS